MTEPEPCWECASRPGAPWYCAECDEARRQAATKERRASIRKIVSGLALAPWRWTPEGEPSDLPSNGQGLIFHSNKASADLDEPMLRAMALWLASEAKTARCWPPSILWVTTAELFNALRENDADVSSLWRKDVVVLREMGAEHRTLWRAEQFMRLLDSRLEARARGRFAPFWATSRLGPTEVAEAYGAAGAGIAVRLSKLCDWKKVS